MCLFREGFGLEIVVGVCGCNAGGRCAQFPRLLLLRQGWGRWSEAWEVGASRGSACSEGCPCPGAFVWDVEVPEVPCGSESVYWELTTINHACHIPDLQVSLDLRLISVLEIAGLGRSLISKVP